MKNAILLLLFTLVVFGCSNKRSTEEGNGSDVLNLYTQRHYAIDKEVFELFEQQTGITVNVVNAGADELITRLEQESEERIADLFYTVDASRLNRAKQLDLLQSVETNANPRFSDPENFWHGITYRARVIAYDKEAVDPAELSTYEDLADEKWRGKILVRSSTSGYNQSLLASIIYASGETAAEE